MDKALIRFVDDSNSLCVEGDIVGVNKDGELLTVYAKNVGEKSHRLVYVPERRLEYIDILKGCEE